MLWDELQDQWKRVTGQGRPRWIKLTVDGELDRVEGWKDLMFRRVRTRYDALKARVSTPPRVPAHTPDSDAADAEVV